MHRSSHLVSRALAFIIMAVGLFALGAGAAAAAPGNVGSAPRAAAQTVDVCLSIDADGDGTISDLELAAAITIDLDGDGSVGDADDLLLIAGIGSGSCSAAIADDDADGVRNGEDNCVDDANADQADLDGDGIGDVCDDDIDGDGLDNVDETEIGTDPTDPDTDGDGVNDGDEVAEGADPLVSDVDRDGVADTVDNCVNVANADQADADGDGVGDACDATPDGDDADVSAGNVNASVYYCDNIDEIVFQSNALSTLAVEETAPACEAGFAALVFYLVGDGTDDFVQLFVDGANSIALEEGTYEVYVEGYAASAFIDVVAGENTTLVVQLPSGEEPVDPTAGTVNVSKFYCDNVNDVIFQAGTTGEADAAVAAAAIEVPEANCAPGYALFSFYPVGDGTADYAQLEVDGANTIGLPEGTYEVVEEGTLASTLIDVVAGENTTLVVQNPWVDPGTPSDPGTDDGTDGDGHVPGDGHNHRGDGRRDGAKAESTTSPGTTVTTLPSTGAGESQGASLPAPAWMLMLGAAMLSAGAFQVSRRQANR